VEGHRAVRRVIFIEERIHISFAYLTCKDNAKIRYSE